MRSVDSLRPYGKNARLHTDAQVDQIAASISEFGWTNPILVDESGLIIAGHGRLLAAKKMEMEEVPTIVLRGLSSEQKKALRLADNKLALNAGWDEDLLRIELGELRADGFNLDLTGFGELEVESLFAPETNPADEWQHMPEFDQKDQTAFQSIMVHFKDEAAVESFARTIGQKIGRKTRFTWFPQVAEDPYIDKRYVADDTKISDLHSLKGAF